jgi:uncharacterized protein
MKASKYNLFIREEGGYILFNTLSKGLFYVDEEMASAIRDGHFHLIPFSFLNDLIDRGIVLEEKYDELQIVKAVYWREKFQRDRLGVTILPTYKCNLECTYCSQGKRKAAYDMSEEIAEKTYEWTVSQIEAANFRHLDIVFYGGEPFLNKEVLLYISRKFKEYCEKASLGFSISIITNGTLLSPLLVKELLNLNLSHLQITLDGPPEIHDKRRVTKRGKGTFSTIFNNVLRLIEISGRLRLTIRINVDQQNYLYVFPFIEFLQRNGIFKFSNVDIDIGMVDITNCNRAYKKNVLSDREVIYFFKDYVNYLNSCSIKSLKSSFTRIPGYPTFCGMVTANSFAIDPLGRIYKCLELLNIDLFCLGNVEEGISTYKHLWWLSASPFEDPKCLACVLLPLCGGGCTAHAFFRYRDLYKRVCPWQTQIIEDIIKYRVKTLYANKLRI